MKRRSPKEALEVAADLLEDSGLESFAEQLRLVAHGSTRGRLVFLNGYKLIEGEDEDYVWSDDTLIVDFRLKHKDRVNIVHWPSCVEQNLDPRIVKTRCARCRDNLMSAVPGPVMCSKCRGRTVEDII